MAHKGELLLIQTPIGLDQQNMASSLASRMSEMIGSQRVAKEVSLRVSVDKHIPQRFQDLEILRHDRPVSVKMFITTFCFTVGNRSGTRTIDERQWHQRSFQTTARRLLIVISDPRLLSIKTK